MQNTELEIHQAIDDIQSEKPDNPKAEFLNDPKRRGAIDAIQESFVSSKDDLRIDPHLRKELLKEILKENTRSLGPVCVQSNLQLNQGWFI